MNLAFIHAQLSPGDLTKAHEELEGIGNCTQCHSIGNQVPDQKCIECHTEISQLINASRGFHASESATSQTCIDCHSEHHGRMFEISRFDQDNFDHMMTGYGLEGMHGIIDCKSCHQPDYIVDQELKSREQTFLGLDEACLTCHQDFHQGTLNNDCISCHNFQDFRPAPGFDHDDTNYILRGAHEEVDCMACHPIISKNGSDYQEFAGISFVDCMACHEDPHEERIGGSCATCHQVSSFNIVTGIPDFNHQTTDFDLRGSHDYVACFDCHSPDIEVANIFSDHAGITETQCIACHEDVHEGKFGADCASCHNEESFVNIESMPIELFEHNLTDYPLEGLHVVVDCKACHQASFLEPIDHNQCKNCHEDYHNEEFAEGEAISPDCSECHTVEHTFEYTLYGIDEHQESSFPLEGAHLATPCFACHITEEEHWTFRNIGSDCIHCHEDIHKGYISETYYPEQSCSSCHDPDQWADVIFDHSTTDWPLEGKHNEVSCRECHFESVEGILDPVQTFTDLSKACVDCHDHPHGVQFEVEGVTDCRECHNNTTWFPAHFDHNSTAFPLDGRHAEIDCSACHKPSAQDQTEMTIYKIEKFECIDCHS